MNDLLAIGSQETARQVVRRAAREVSAYQTFLAEHDGSPDDPWERLPVTDKTTYLSRFPFSERVGGDFANTFTIFSSSGSSGQPFYWPQLKDGHADSADKLRQFLETAFRIRERKTLAIVGLALGSWIGGDHFSWVLKSMAVRLPYPFAVFSPGNKHDEIIAMIESATPFVDQIILFVCPSAIGHLLLRARQNGRTLPLTKLRYIVIGEPFPESMRGQLHQEAGAPPTEPVMFSIYGSADTGVLGVESPASVALRQVCHVDPVVRAGLGFETGTPHFFHLADPTAYIESLAGELCVTKWQGVPLLRYNLHDRVELLRWSDVRQVVQNHDELPDLMAILGRADRCLILCGTNLTEFMLNEALRCPELQDLLTGLYRAAIIFEEGRQRLDLTLEFRNGVAVDLDRVYRGLVRALGQVQPEFRDDWQNIYRQWDDDPARRILRLQAVTWPELSHRTETDIKQRAVQ